jgi:hypothetical protein
VYDIDETGVYTFVQSPKIVAQLGTKQVGQAASGERGTLITVCMIINSVGNTVPYAFIFPRVRLHDSLMLMHYLKAWSQENSPYSSWTTGPLFL